MRTDQYVHPDYYNMDDLLSEEHKLVRDAARAWVKKEVSPIIDEHYEKATFPKHLLAGLGEIGVFGPYIPEEYGGPGLDQISYGLIMQELERCDSGLRSTASVQSSLVMYPIWKYGSEEQKQKYWPHVLLPDPWIASVFCIHSDTFLSAAEGGGGPVSFFAFMTLTKITFIALFSIGWGN